ncbi:MULTISPECIES: hypothetical protein [Paenibacillus]|uniref:hypothetical protein n=1 Tax=Paenibacillus TaxID=44249 RepID=UPI0022B92498|nr:hypothetical protein [Paenibacillus caseinilyticus]MCZ8519254.1 hypothetical protein [Paenibacillus caseinilyticus]
MKRTKRSASRRSSTVSAAGARELRRPPRQQAKPAVKPSRPRYAAPDVEGLYTPFGAGFPFSYAQPGASVREAGEAAEPAGGAPQPERAAGGAGGGAASADWFGQLGGLDGILATMGKVQKMYNIARQFGPIFKLMGGFGGFGGLGGLGGGPVKTASVRTRKKPPGLRGTARRKP